MQHCESATTCSAAITRSQRMTSQLQPVGRAPTTSPRIQTQQASSCHVHGVSAAGWPCGEMLYWCHTYTMRRASEATACQPCVATQVQALTRRETFAALASGALATSAALFTPGTATASIMACPGLNGYALSKCLKEARKAAAASEDAEGTDAGDDVQSARLKYRQFEQPGELVTLPSGSLLLALLLRQCGGGWAGSQARSNREADVAAAS